MFGKKRLERKCYSDLWGYPVHQHPGSHAAGLWAQLQVERGGGLEAEAVQGSRRPPREPDPRPRESKARRAKTYQTKEKIRQPERNSLQGSPQL